MNSSTSVSFPIHLTPSDLASATVCRAGKWIIQQLPAKGDGAETRAAHPQKAFTHRLRISRCPARRVKAALASAI